MKIKRFDVDVYNWSVSLIEIDSIKDFEKLSKELTDFGVEWENIKFYEKCLKEGIAGGTCFSSKIGRNSIILIYNSLSKDLRNEIICHEKRHLENKIEDFCELGDNEAMAYLAGYLGKMLLCEK